MSVCGMVKMIALTVFMTVGAFLFLGHGVSNSVII